MKCTWQVGYDPKGNLVTCQSPAVLHWVGNHPRTGRSTTGVARCKEHEHFRMAGDDFSALAPFFDAVPLRWGHDDEPTKGAPKP